MSAPKSTATKNAAKAASGAAEFKKRKSGKLLLLPSGLSLRCKRVEMSTLLKQGDVPNPLIPIVEEALLRGKNVDAAAMVGEEGKVDMTMVDSMFEMVNTVVCASSLEPQVHEVPELEEDRSDDVVYIDEIDEEDRMFIFQWVLGGTEDVATFRREAEADLVALGQS